MDRCLSNTSFIAAGCALLSLLKLKTVFSRRRHWKLEILHAQNELWYRLKSITGVPEQTRLKSITGVPEQTLHAQNGLWYRLKGGQVCQNRPNYQRLAA